MGHEIKYEETKNHCFDVEVLYDHDEDGDREVIWSGQVSFSPWQVQDGNLESRMQQIAENRITEFEQRQKSRDKKSGELEL